MKGDPAGEPISTTTGGVLFTLSRSLTLLPLFKGLCQTQSRAHATVSDRDTCTTWVASLIGWLSFHTQHLPCVDVRGYGMLYMVTFSLLKYTQTPAPTRESSHLCGAHR